MPTSECSFDGLRGRINLAYSEGRTQGATRMFLSRRLKLILFTKRNRRHTRKGDIGRIQGRVSVPHCIIACTIDKKWDKVYVHRHVPCVLRS